MYFLYCKIKEHILKYFKLIKCHFHIHRKVPMRFAKV